MSININALWAVYLGCPCAGPGGSLRCMECCGGRLGRWWATARQGGTGRGALGAEGPEGCRGTAGESWTRSAAGRGAGRGPVVHTAVRRIKMEKKKERKREWKEGKDGSKKEKGEGKGGR